MLTDYKPMLAPNEEMKVEDLPFPLLASYKYDGIRGVIRPTDFVTRSLKPIPNSKLEDKFAPIQVFAKKRNIILDGELYDPTMTFPDLSGLCRRFDAPIPFSLKYYVFDRLDLSNLKEGFSDRILRLENDLLKFRDELSEDLIVQVKHKIVNSVEEVREFFQEALDNGFEGLILRSLDGHYKFGRGTIKEGLIFKLKPFVTFDSQIIGVVQGTKVDPKAEKKINELGRSVTSKKKGDRILVEKACDFEVMHDGKLLKVSIAKTDPEKEEIWKNRESYIGRWIEYKGLLIGSKDLPRHPVLVRYREDKD